MLENRAMFFLCGAIFGEIAATTALKAANGFTVLLPSLVVVMGYSVAFYCLSIALKTIPVGIAYALWSGIGTLVVTCAATVFYRQRLEWPGLIGIGLIAAGSVLVNISPSKVP